MLSDGRLGCYFHPWVTGGFWLQVEDTMLKTTGHLQDCIKLGQSCKTRGILILPNQCVFRFNLYLHRAATGEGVPC